MESKQINCCNLTQMCAGMAHFHQGMLNKHNSQTDHVYTFSFGAIHTIWNIYANLRDNQVLCETCLRFSDLITKLRIDLGKRAREKLCEFCGRSIWGLATEYKKEKNIITEIPQDKYCCSKQVYIIDETAIKFEKVRK